MDAFLRQQIDGVPQIRQLDVADATGNRIATTVASPSPLNLSGRGYFQQLMHASGSVLMISEPIRGLNDGKPTFAVAKRLEDGQGRFSGVVVALIEDSYFSNFYEQVDLGAGTTIRLLRTDGTPVVEFANHAATALSRHVCTALRRVSGFPLNIEVARNEGVVLATWRRSTISEVIGSAVLSLLVAVLALALAAKVRRLRSVNQQLQSSEQRWRAAFENAPVGIMVLRAQGTYIAANPAFQRMVGYSLAELVELTPVDITHPDDAPLTQRFMNQLEHGEQDSVRLEKRYMHRDGHVVLAELCLARATISIESSAYAEAEFEDVLVATVEDITQRCADEKVRRELENQLRQSQKLEALGTFAGGIAHDFNNILGAIIGYGERALHALAQDTPERRYVEQVLKAGDRARALVERILTFSRSSITPRSPVRLQPVVAETIELLKGRMTEDIVLATQLDVPHACISGDAGHMHQVVMNLCSNALHAMPEGGTLRVELALRHVAARLSLSHGAIGPGDFVRLTVSDNGVGMTPELIERIFNPFFTTRRAGEGTGLGLALVDGIVREYGGGVDVRSAVGAGTTFDVYLPVTEIAPEASADDSTALPRGAGQVVLLVDDEKALVELGEETLAELGYEPVGFASSVEAWNEFAASPERFDVVITDQTMPDLTGIELAARIRAVRPAVPIVLCSGYSTAALEQEAKAAGIAEVLRKPLRQAAIAHALKAALSKTVDEAAG